MEAPEVVGVAIEAALKIILQKGLPVAGQQWLFDCPRPEIDQYFQAVDEIQSWMESTVETAHCSQALDEIQLWLESSAESGLQKIAEKAISMAMARLEVEFENILTGHTSPRYSSCSSFSSTSSSRFSLHEEDYTEYAAPPEEVMYDLRRITERMNSAGHLKHCVQVYCSVRKDVVNTRFQQLGLGKLSSRDVQWLESEVLETKIKEWIRAAKVSVRVLFSNEKRLHDQVFEGLHDECFMMTVTNSARQLYDYVEVLSSIRPSAQRLFMILDLHKSFSDLLPDLELLFSLKFFRILPANILGKLTESVREIISQFAKDLRFEKSQILPVPGDTIIFLTRYVMDYISRISEYKHTLVGLIVSKPTTGSRDFHHLATPDMDFAELGEQTPLAPYLIWIIDILQFNLEGKSKQFKDASLAHLFLTNNVHYIVQKIEGSPELRELIGGDYLRKMIGKFGSAATSENGLPMSSSSGVLRVLSGNGLRASSILFLRRFMQAAPMLNASSRLQHTSVLRVVFMYKIVLRLELHDDKFKQKAMKKVSGLSGVFTISMDMNGKKMTLTGDGLDPIRVVTKLRKLCYTEILSVGPAKEPEKKKEEPMKEEPKKTDDKKKDSKDDAKVGVVKRRIPFSACFPLQRLMSTEQ